MHGYYLQDFHHYYHGEFDQDDGLFSGLPQQWISLVAITKESVLSDTDGSRSVIIEGQLGTCDTD